MPLRRDLCVPISPARARAWWACVCARGVARAWAGAVCARGAPLRRWGAFVALLPRATIAMSLEDGYRAVADEAARWLPGLYRRSLYEGDEAFPDPFALSHDCAARWMANMHGRAAQSRRHGGWRALRATAAATTTTAAAASVGPVRRTRGGSRPRSGRHRPRARMPLTASPRPGRRAVDDLLRQPPRSPRPSATPRPPQRALRATPRSQTLNPNCARALTNTLLPRVLEENRSVPA